ncbi:MAG TPA: acylneuraminate cytidylyltransferase family protein [Leptospiraceae bacterium]|nr:acylneuraminate cytidylyltransferase family protein [Leptospirales bacterium]HMU85495.1 acylneuraminate cytidylyltransferase family protein [Leptospiraceae bacterium]HMW60391.1 acylneuraminate cytidylyltransferase family protein [Leptospiraceae bacterium]HMX57263.1 acylneuraminate cytidylyltransferase family protein [Leptospiraceae bacterium]HMY45673.1 acylneuraminate cytidylyltransferase family protein [Leptospiraceae bacterium]
MTTKPRILGITLARGGSKSVPHKNIRPILGVPLIAYTIRAALASQYLTRYIISTDDPEIRDTAIRYGADAPFLRPAEFSTDTASSVSALQHAVSWVEKEENSKYDYIIEMMCTNPLKTTGDIDSCIQKLVETGADSVIAVHKLDDHHPIRIKKIVDDLIVDFCLPEVPEMRRQDLKPDAYIRSGSIYALSRKHLMEENRRFGSKHSRPYILPPERAINVDTEIDFLIAEKILEKAASGT